MGSNVGHTAQKQPTEPTVTRRPGKQWESKARVSCRQGQPSHQEGDRPHFWGRGLPWILNGHQISIPHSTAAAFLKRFTKSFRNREGNPEAHASRSLRTAALTVTDAPQGGTPGE